MFGIRRTVKKAAYAALFILVILTFSSPIVYGGFNRLRQLWRIVEAPHPQQREPIIVERVDTVVHADTVDIAARVRNPNPGAGIPDYTVTFVLLDSNGKEIESVVSRTYILPGSLNYIAAIGIPLSTQLGSIKVNLSPNPTFVSLPEHISLPSFNTFVRERRIRSVGQRQLEEVRGIVINTSALDFSRVEITSVAIDSTGQVVGVGSTFVGELRVGEQREFSVQWPLPSRQGERILILPSTNIYLEGNILPIKGDPDLLR